ncbi:MAG: FHA domain-containing protein [Vicinamibacterales bacterium]
MWILRSTTLDKEQTIRLPPGTARTVGRGPRSDFVIDSMLLSRVHCRMSTTSTQLVVEDLKSTNGTYVNDTRVECIALNNGDCLRLGRVEFLVSREEQ